MTSSEFPQIPKVNACEKIFGEEICDPYKGIEKKIGTFLGEMKVISDRYLPEDKRKKQAPILSRVYDYERRSCPQHVSNRLVYLLNSGTMPCDVLVQEELDVKLSNLGYSNIGNFEYSDVENEVSEFVASDDVSENENFVMYDVVGEPQVSASAKKQKNVPIKGKMSLVADINNDHCIITTFACSIDGDFVAYSCRKLAKPYKETIVYHSLTENKKIGVIPDVNFPSIAWTRDSIGFFYTRDSGNYAIGPKIYYHYCLPNVNPQKDIEIADFSGQKYWKMKLFVSENGRYLIMVVSSDKKGNFVYFTKIPKDGVLKGRLMYYQVVNKWKRKYKYITSIGSRVIFLTDRYAPKGCLIQFSLNFKIPKCHCHWRMIIAEKLNDLLVDAVCVTENRFFCHYLKPAGFSYIEVYKCEVQTFKVVYKYEFRDLYITEMTSSKNSFAYIKLESDSQPPIIFRYDFSLRRGAPISEPKLVFQSISPMSENVKCKHEYRHTTDIRVIITLKTSDNASYRDIDRIIAKLKGHKANEPFKSIEFSEVEKSKETTSENQSTKPKVCLLIVNGGFGELNVPQYDAAFHYLIAEYNVILARVMIPGGGERGRIWHKKGKLHNKMQFLSKIKNTERMLLRDYGSKIVIYGRHNGGLIAASIAVRIPLPRHGIIAEEPIIDLFNINNPHEGDKLISEYGNARNCYNDFQTIKLYEPYYNLDPSTKFDYPMLITCSIVEEIFHYRHAMKFVARVLPNAAHNKPALFIAYDIPVNQPKSLEDTLNRKIDQVTFIIEHVCNEFQIKPKEDGKHSQQQQRSKQQQQQQQQQSF